MFKLIKRLFLLGLVLLVAAAVWGYQNGMTKDNYQEFISNTLAEYQQGQTPQPSPEVDKKAKSKKNNPKTQKAIKETSAETEEYRLSPLPKNPFHTIDQHARNVPASATTDVETLAAFLQQKASTDIEKARALYVWMTDNIRYDDAAYNSKNYPKYTTDYVLHNRKAICEGYSNLFLDLGRAMDLDVEKVVGYSKGYGYREGERFTESTHAWNVVRINGAWTVFDATWGAGFGENINGQLRSTKKFDPYWFNQDPYEAIFSHFPEDPAFKLVQSPVSSRQYEKMPNIKEAYFKLGFKGRETFSRVLSDPYAEFPATYSINTPIELLAAPPLKNLELDQSYAFEFYIPRAYQVAIIDSKNSWIYFNRKKGKFSLNFTPKELGDLMIVVQTEENSKTFKTFLEYQVKDLRPNS